MKHVTWDYEESTNKYYQIYGISDEGEYLLGDSSICIDVQETKENDVSVASIVNELDKMAESRIKTF